MTHLIQFSVDLDEDSIRKQIINHTADMVEKAMFEGGKYVEHSYYGVKMSSSMKDIVEEAVGNFLTENADKIVEATAKQLSEKLARSKKGKQILEGLE